MKKSRWFATCLFLIFALGSKVHTGSEDLIEPIEYTYATVDSSGLKAFVFTPEFDFDSESERLPAIVLFHGGGWAMGEPSWAFDRARHFADLGLVAVAAQYRLADQREITPLEAMQDSRSVIRWMRQNADSLHINPTLIAAYGWSAGAHLAASAAVFAGEQGDPSCIPDLLILVSPALSVVNDGWFRQLLLNKVPVESVSPAEHIPEEMPPAIILAGRDDTVTPLKEEQKFVSEMKAKGHDVELHIFDNVGHMFTPSGQRDDGQPRPDKQVQSTAYTLIDEFLEAHGFRRD